ncbi:MAG: CoA-binding protein, partial [Hyphomicrobiaceae bacterium]
MSLLSLFEPRGIAIVGASSDPNRIGGQPVRALKASGYTGGIYPVNPNRPEIQGLRAYPSIAAIDGPCDMAVIIVASEDVPAAIEACAKKSIRHAVILTSGFAEAGEEGRRREKALAEEARGFGIRVLGPNCQGVISVPSRVFAVFGSISGEVDVRPGSLSAAFQSGGVGFAAMNLAEQQGAGLRHMVSTGNGSDIGIVELLDTYLEDPGTRVAFGYLEGTGEGRQLIELGAKSLAARKPVLIWKAARSEVGSRAAHSHTGNLAGSYD